jgi:hypothetical protein
MESQAADDKQISFNDTIFRLIDSYKYLHIVFADYYDNGSLNKGYFIDLLHYSVCRYSHYINELTRFVPELKELNPTINFSGMIKFGKKLSYKYSNIDINKMFDNINLLFHPFMESLHELEIPSNLKLPESPFFYGKKKKFSDYI